MSVHQIVVGTEDAFDATVAAYAVTPVHTAVPLTGTGSLAADLAAKGYELYSSGSLVGPGGYIYSAYYFIDPTESEWLDPGNAFNSYEDTAYVAFYRWDGETNDLLRIFTLTPYENNIGGTVYPVVSRVVDWNHPRDSDVSPWILEAFPDEDTRQLLRLDHYASDINRNGLPEFAVANGYCTTSCSHLWDFHSGVFFYEIQPNGQIIHLTESLPGLLDYPDMIYTADPLTFWVWDVSYDYDMWVPVETWWFYQWQGDHFVDVSTQFAERYLRTINKQLEKLRGYSEEPYYRIMDQEFAKVLILYDKAGLRDQALAPFLELTDLSSHWPGTEKLNMCQLQVLRTQVQESYAAGRPLWDVPTIQHLERSFELQEAWVKEQIDAWSQAGYDLSACDAYKVRQ